MKYPFEWAAGCALLFLPLICFGHSSHVAPDLADVDPNSVVNVIVQFVSPPSNRDFQAIGQLGGIPQQADLGLIHAAVYSMPAQAIAALAKYPNVGYISPDRAIYPTLDYANATIGAQVAFSSGWTGTGVGVAIIDSGILSEKDLLKQGSTTTRIVYSQSF